MASASRAAPSHCLCRNRLAESGRPVVNRPLVVKETPAFLWLHSGVSFRPIMVAKASSSTTSGLAHLRIRTLQPRRLRGNPAQGIPRKQGLLLIIQWGMQIERSSSVWITHQRDSEHDLAGASLDHQHRQELDRLEEVLAQRELQQDIAVLQAELAASQRDIEQEQELNQLEEVLALRELQQDIAELQAESAASQEKEQELSLLEELLARRELQQDIVMLQRDWLEEHSVEH